MFLVDMDGRKQGNLSVWWDCYTYTMPRNGLRYGREKGQWGDLFDGR